MDMNSGTGRARAPQKGNLFVNQAVAEPIGSTDERTPHEQLPAQGAVRSRRALNTYSNIIQGSESQEFRDAPKDNLHTLKNPKDRQPERLLQSQEAARTTGTPAYWISTSTQVSAETPPHLTASQEDAECSTPDQDNRSTGIQYYSRTANAIFPLNKEEGELLEPQGDSDLEIFQAIRNQVQNRRRTGQQLLSKYPHLGLSFTNSEYEEIAALVTRVAPDLTRYIQTYYPGPHSETIPISQNKDNPKEVLTPILEETCTRQTSTTETPEQANLVPISSQEKERPPPVRITMTADRVQTYQEKMKNLTNYMVLGHISGRTPGARKLSMWAKAKLHRSFHQLTIRSNNYFEIQFSQEGRMSTLASQGSTLEGGDITFYSWSPYFNTDHPLNKSGLKIGIWAQVRELPPFLRTQEFLRILANYYS